MPSLNTRNLVPGLPGTVPVKRLSSTGTGCDQLVTLLGLDRDTPVAQAKAVGVSLRLTKKGSIDAIAFATETHIVHVVVDGNAAQPEAGKASLRGRLSRLLSHSECVLAGFDVARILLLLHRQFELHSQGVEIGLVRRGKSKASPSPGSLACDVLHENAQKYRINALWYDHSNENLHLRAWMTACLAATLHADVMFAAKLKTEALHASHLSCVALQVMNVELLENEKPTHYDNDFEQVERNTRGDLVLHNSRFKTRVRRSQQTYIQVNGNEVHANAVRARGRESTLRVFSGKLTNKVTKVRVVGREEATSAESARDLFVVRLLQGNGVLDQSRFVRLVWFPKSEVTRRGNRGPANDEEFTSLNPSQRRVAAAMIADGDPLVIAHGPPGTGKTSTIAAALKYWEAEKEPVWVVAQSNVSVKSIVRSIIEKGTSACVREVKWTPVSAPRARGERPSSLNVLPLQVTLADESPASCSPSLLAGIRPPPHRTLGLRMLHEGSRMHRVVARFCRPDLDDTTPAAGGDSSRSALPALTVSVPARSKHSYKHSARAKTASSNDAPPVHDSDMRYMHPCRYIPNASPRFVVVCMPPPEMPCKLSNYRYA
ncbi:hypothetical protein BV20DRAFT_1027212 [Pilatotrama ljubarskyi]|nr:hypothetical protein BV20DRAFT_1027212 [Pilatotrama ljubarskyi]